MKATKLLLKILAGLVAVILVLGLIQPKHFESEYSISIDAPKEAIFKKINNLKTWEEWGPWKAVDPTIVVTYGEKTEGPGASYSWAGDKKLTGSGKLTISESTPSSFVKTSLEFDGQGKGEGWFRLEDGDDGGTVAYWGMGFEVPYPFNAFTIFRSSADKKKMDDMFNTGLSNLKEICEKENNKPGILEVQPIDFSGQSFLAIRGKVKMDDNQMQQFFAKSFGAISAALGSHGLEMAGHPSGLYYKWDEETMVADMAAAAPVLNGEKAVSGNIRYVEIPAGKGLLIEYFGSYDGIGRAHNTLDEYLKANNLSMRSPVIEEYVTDPGTESDPSKWLTKIYYFYE